ncbi:MAG: GNAT family N-acetyltransferase [Pirellulales bacterium]|nr:GNAT family N-acetyltransferase [Pirellulales bacterium]
MKTYDNDPILNSQHPSGVGLHTLSFVSASNQNEFPAIETEWEKISSENTNLYAFYQSPLWWNHMTACNNAANLHLAIARDVQDKLVGASPVYESTYQLHFPLSRSHAKQIPLRTAVVSGGQPALPADNDLYGKFFNSLWDRFPMSDAVYMKSIPLDSPCWNYFQQTNWRSDSHYVYLPDGVRLFHSVDLPESFQEYLGQFNRKKRYNLKRQERVLRDNCKGNLKLMRIESKDQADEFVNALRAASHCTWQYEQAGIELGSSDAQRDRFVDLAERGSLRSYLLQGNGEEVAFVVGYQYRDVFHYSDVGYVQSYSRYSPGSVLLYMLIRDLIGYRSPRRINFGIGDSSYKRQFGNNNTHDADILLLRRTFKNAARLNAHALYKRTARFAKAVLHKSSFQKRSVVSI